MTFLTWIGNETLVAQVVSGLDFWALCGAIIVCMAILSKGADLMINGAVSLAQLTGLPEVIIGATILSLGTTLPEVFVSVFAAWSGNPGLALGNGVGSIICDTGMILGLTCILARVPVDKFILNRSDFVQVGAATLMVFLCLLAYFRSPENPTLHRWVGVLFLVLLSGYLFLSYRWSRENPDQEETRTTDWGQQNIAKTLLGVIIGIGGVILASRLLISCAAEGATRMGVPQDVIATTLVAFGTSLPELVTAITAVRKGHPRIMVGNIIGANVLNCLFVIGAATTASPIQVPPNFFTLHFPAMLIILYSFRFFIYINKDGWFKRVQGAWIFSIYITYLLLQYRFTLFT